MRGGCAQLAAVALALAAGLVAAQAQVQVSLEQMPTVSFLGRTTTSAETTFAYRVVVSSAQPALARWTLEVCPQMQPSVTVTLPSAPVTFGTDALLSIAGLSFGGGQQRGQTVDYAVTLRGNVSQADVRYGLVGADAFSNGLIPGPRCYNSSKIPSVCKIFLSRAGSGGDIRELRNGDTINLNTLTGGFSLRAELCFGNTVFVPPRSEDNSLFSVRFDVDNRFNLQTENFTPYALVGDNSGSLNAWQRTDAGLTRGMHTVRATAFAENGLQGASTATYSITYLVEGQTTASDIPARCISWGDPHIVSFDGRKYDWQLTGEHVLYNNTMIAEQVNVLQYKPAASRVAYNQGMALRSGANRFQIVIENPLTQAPPVLRFNGDVVMPASGLHVFGPFSVSVTGALQTRNLRYTIVLASGTEVSVTFSTYVGVLHENINVVVSGRYYARTMGICGSYDGNSGNDVPPSATTFLVTNTTEFRNVSDPPPPPTQAEINQTSGGSGTTVTPQDLTTNQTLINVAQNVCSSAAPDVRDACVIDYVIGGDVVVSVASSVQVEVTTVMVAPPVVLSCINANHVVMGAWSNWTACSASCGPAARTRSRTVTLLNGTSCGETVESEACTQPSCDVDCVMSDWSAWGTCSLACGGGVQTRNRSVVSAAQGSGQPCGTTVEIANCNTSPCPIDCVVGDWGNFTHCSASCGGGTQTRMRNVTTQPAHNGTACPPTVEVVECNTQSCPVNCVMGNWSAWGACSASCAGGVQWRNRSVVTPAANGGAECGATAEWSPCNEQPCPVHCELSNWTAWSHCTASCGGGLQSRNRSVVTAAAHGGSECGELHETAPCNTQPCPVDCVPGNWSAWSLCTASCGGGTQTRTRPELVVAQFGGSACENLTQEQACNIFACPVDCVEGAWSNWTHCSASCGSGLQTRSRGVLVQPEHGGRACGETEEVVFCNTQPCPVDCQVGAYGDWSVCSALCGGGQQTRSRNVTVEPQHGGSVCPPLVQFAECNTAPCPVDCEVTPYGAWSACSVSCGGGHQTRWRNVTRDAAHGGSHCPSLNETRSCNEAPCPVDCVLSDWADYGQCSVSCGGGLQVSTRSVVVPQSHGGAVCDNVTSRTRECNTQPCPVHCVLSNWTAWGACSRPCGSGQQQRTRDILQGAAHGGTECGDLVETQPCNTQSCPRDCAVGAWGAWSACSINCGGGLRFRSRNVTTPPQNGGAPCPDLSEAEACNTHECPVNCEVGSWSAWSACSASCGGGVSFRNRTIVVDARFGGDACGALSQEVACNTGPCPVDGVTTAWSEWGNCSQPCGGGSRSRSRTVVVASANGGRECGELQQTEQCNTEVCPVDCVATEWTAWSACSRTCGGGVRNRTRSIVQHPNEVGVPCVGGTFQEEPCNTHECPVDCVLSAWSGWSACTVLCGGGQQSRTRTVTTASANGGAACGELSEARECNTQPCPVHCEVSNWTDWSACSATCGGGLQTRSRNITQPNAFGGTVCPETHQSRECALQPCPVDCVLSAWSAWSTCSVSCGDGGMHTRSRTIVRSDAFNGQPCGALVESGECSAEAPCAVHCVMGNWSAWSQCSASCGGGNATRTREIVQEPAHGGAACGAVSETEVCNTQPCPVDCRLSAWSNWTDCSSPCGGGLRHRTRHVEQVQAHGGAACPPGALYEAAECNPQPCPQHCEVSAWSAWSSCSHACGNGTQSRTRTVVTESAFGGDPCGAREELRACNDVPCPVDCLLSAFSEWSACSAPCGGGLQLRNRTVVQHPAYGGAQCGELSEARVCNPLPCPVHCVQSEWSAWTACSAHCGGGNRTRVRDVVQPPMFGGGECGSNVEVEACNTHMCPVDCRVSNWSAWSECTATCGGGLRAAHRTVLQVALYGGEVCPELSREEACNTDPCPVHCEMSAWGNWSACSASCGPGSRVRTRSVLQAPLNNGHPCPAETEVAPCEVAECPVDCGVSAWSEWGACSVSCGTGHRSRTRNITQFPSSGGHECPPRIESEPCEQTPCPVHCELTNFTEWGACSVPCGGGLQRRTRDVVRGAEYGGLACGALSEERPCNTQGCPTDCEVGGWTEWSECSAPCAGGLRSRTRPVLVVDSMGGLPCPHLSESEDCNTHACPVDCQVGEWSAWSPCSASCGFGRQSRSRNVTALAEHGGAACGELAQSRMCHVQPCPVDCVMDDWSAWSPCSASCGGGVRERSRGVTRLDAFGGQACGATIEVSECNTEPCAPTVHPRDCQMSEWSAWDRCERRNGELIHTHSRVRLVLAPPALGGAACGNTSQTEQCRPEDWVFSAAANGGAGGYVHISTLCNCFASAVESHCGCHACDCGAPEPQPAHCSCHLCDCSLAAPAHCGCPSLASNAHLPLAPRRMVTAVVYDDDDAGSAASGASSRAGAEADEVEVQSQPQQPQQQQKQQQQQQQCACEDEVAVVVVAEERRASCPCALAPNAN